ncbi:MAG: hypothetical protein V4543_09640 [Bacteroidota bacterium]
MQSQTKDIRFPLEADLRIILEQKQAEHTRNSGKKPTLPALLQEMARLGLEESEGSTGMEYTETSASDLRVTELEEREAELLAENVKLKKKKKKLEKENEALKLAGKTFDWQQWLMILAPSAIAIWQTYQLNKKEQDLSVFAIEIGKQLKNINMPIEQKMVLIKQMQPFLATLPAEVQEVVKKILAGQQN